MMPTVAKKQVSRVETDLDVTDYLGINNPREVFNRPFAESPLVPGEFLFCKNLNLYRTGYMPSRSGSTRINPASTKLGAGDVMNGLVWDTGFDNYLIVQQRFSPTVSKFYFSSIGGIGFSPILNYGGGDLTITHAVAALSAQMIISNDRLYIFHEDGNLIVEFDGVSSFKGRALGLAPAYFDSTNPIFPSGAGAFDGRWTYGIELVYRRGGSDFASSGITRLYNDFAQATTAHLSAIGGLFVKALAGSFTLPAGVPTGSLTTGMCVRIWRSKNQFSESTDPLFPVDVQGSPDELYPRVIFTYDDFATALFSYSDFDLSDRVLIDAGDLTTIVEIATTEDYIGLQQLPNAGTGTFHRDRIWVGSVPSIDSTRSKLAYSATAGTPYQEQYNPLNIVPCEPGDGQKITGLVSFERDLIVIKEAKTLRIQDGDPANRAETMDHAIGVFHFKFSKFIPGIGIIAVVNDRQFVRIFGYDLKWSSLFGDQDISRKLGFFTSSLITTFTSIEYCNGKLFLVKGDTAEIYVLHVEQGKGWTQYVYKLASAASPTIQRAELVTTWANGTRLVAISGNRYQVELDDILTSSDINTNGDVVETFNCSWKTHRYQMEGGRLMMEYRYYSVIAQLSTVMYGMSHVNGTPWPDPAGTFAAGKVAMVPDPTMYNPQNALKETDYKLFLPPPRPCANLFGFEFETAAPCTIRSQRLNCIAFTGQLNPNFDPYSVMRFKPSGPPWAKPSAPSWQSEILVAFTAMGATIDDHSGRQRTHVFSAGVGPGLSRANIPVMFPTSGGRVTGSATSGVAGWIPAPGVTYNAMETMGAAPSVNTEYTTWKIVMNLTGTPLGEGTIAQGGNGDEFWQLNHLMESGAFDGQLEFRTYRGGTVARTWRSLDVVPANQDAENGNEGSAYGKARLILMFSYKNTGDLAPPNDDFILYMDSSIDEWGGRRRTTVEDFNPALVDPIPTIHSIFPGYIAPTRDIALYQIETGIVSDVEASRFFEVMKDGDQPTPPE